VADGCKYNGGPIKHREFLDWVMTVIVCRTLIHGVSYVAVHRYCQNVLLSRMEMENAGRRPTSIYI
jgi:hypothetical protein